MKGVICAKAFSLWGTARNNDAPTRRGRLREKRRWSRVEAEEEEEEAMELNSSR